ncbi:MAG: SDR family NAD(P)-dependent oxidoreductase [Syntrophaceae bacterium]
MRRTVKSFADKVVYVTGGSSGIGLATARLFAMRGAHVVICARDAAKLEQALGSILQARLSDRQRIHAVTVDVTDEADVLKKMAAAVGESGAPDILVHSAGRGHADHFENITAATFDAIIKTNVYGTRHVIAAALPYMKAKGGHMVILSSAGGLLGMFGYTAYGTSKFALVGFAECLRAELKRYGIKVCVVCPPEVDTPLVADEGRTIPPEAHAVKHLAGVLKPAYVAETILRGVEKGRFLIIPGFLAKSLYYLQCYLPGRLTRLAPDLVVGITRYFSKD